ncbi:MAG: cysteine--tRNA ligase [Bacilli bacterium]|nr:cysteine--tRNA ligase [Bacilli bacterium]
MKIYNTLTKQIEEFVPHIEKEVKMYTCGPTVYNFSHIGNLRTYIFEDVLEKALNYLGYDVKRAMNITDVGHMTSEADTGDDKMLLGAKREGKTVYEIADFYTKAFFEDAKALNIKRPEIVSVASDNIDEYIKIIKKLLDNEYAYISNGNVYFDVSKANDYYKLSGKNEKDLIVGAREDVEEDTSKHNPFDFGLWFTSSKFDNQAMKWDSPWGVGYPGWHIECSGISMKYLGEYLDIHCGAVDNIFPHHTNEIAQSEAYIGHKWCNYWVHGEFLNDQTGKMSKSKGEFLTLSLLKEKGYNPLTYRFFCLQSHYRNQLLFAYESLNTAASAYNKLKSKIKSITNDNASLDDTKINFYRKEFVKALENDLSTANALTCVFNVTKDELLNNNSKLTLIKEFDTVLSLNLIEEETADLDKEFIKEIELLIEERNEAKNNKDYSKADEIRKQITDKGIIINDTKDGTTWSKGGN